MVTKKTPKKAPKKAPKKSLSKTFRDGNEKHERGDGPTHSNTSMIKIVKSSAEAGEVELLDRWYVRFIALLVTPLFAFLKVYDLARWIGNVFLTALGGVLDFFIFFVCFGWFWDTFLMKKFKKLQCIRFLIKRKAHYHILNIATGFLQAYFMRLLIPLPPKYFNHLTFFCGLFGLFTVLVSMRLGKVHCFCILLLPTLASRHGRRFVLVLLLASLFDGPVVNMQANTGLITAQMSCISKKAQNTSDVMVSSIKERYEHLQDRVLEVKNRTVERMERVTEKVAEVGRLIQDKYDFLVGIINDINQFVEKCESTMQTLNDKCDAAFKCNNKRAADDVLGITHDQSDQWYRELLENITTRSDGFVSSLPISSPPANLLAENGLPTDAEVSVTTVEIPQFLYVANASNQTNTSNAESESLESEEELLPSTNVYYDKELYINHNPADTLHNGKVFHARSKRGFWDVIKCFFQSVAGLLVRPVCNVIFNSIARLCRVPRLLVHFITGIMLKRFAYLENTIHNNIWIDINANLSFQRDVVEVRSAETALTELEERVAARLSIEGPQFMGLMDYLKLVTMILVYVNTYRYMSNYSKDTCFDNIYIDESFLKFDRTADASALPLNKRDLKKYIVMTRREMLPHEKFIAMRSSLKACCYIAGIVVIESGDRILQLLVQLMYNYGPVRVEHYINLEELNNTNSTMPADNSTTMPADNSTRLDGIHLEFDTTSCFQEPTSLPLSLTGYHFLLGALLLTMSLTQIYFLRFRHAVCDSFDRATRRRRTEFLHAKIRKSREYAKKHAAESLFTRVTEKNRLCRLFPWLYKPQCVLCSSKEYIQKCNGCDTVYCCICLKELESTCKICNNLFFQRKSQLSLAKSQQSHHSLS